MENSIKIPPYQQGILPSISSVLKGIVTEDQFDDWLPDPLFYQDQLQNELTVVNRIEKFFQKNECPIIRSEKILVPRNSIKSLPCVALPLDVRIVTHRIIGAIASKLQRVRNYDKVYGFEFEKSSIPLFSKPGEGLVGLFDAVIQAARYDSEYIEILDIVSFSLSTKFEYLAKTLQQAGIRPDETTFLHQIIGLVPNTLPSIDDAFAFIYNFYLHPIDKELLRRKHNFFRYRDEYFTVNNKSSSTIKLLVKQLLNLEVKEVSNFFDFSETEDKLALKAAEESPEENGNFTLTESVGKFSSNDGFARGELIAEYECEWDAEQKECITDTFEVKYSENSINPFKELLSYRDKVSILDGVQILPLIRKFYQQRQYGVLYRPPFDKAPTVFIEYKNKLAQCRTFLQQLLSKAFEVKSNWQIIWTSLLISDLGMLNSQEIILIRKIISDKQIDRIVKFYCCLALARSSSLNADKCWIDPLSSDSRLCFRISLLTARYLANRGSKIIWKKMEGKARILEPELQAYLISNLNG